MLPALLAVFAIVFLAILLAYTLGKGERRLVLWRPQLRALRHYSPPVEIVLEYRDERGATTLRRLRVLKSLVHPDGRLYLRGACPKSQKVKNFRVDRIVSVATIHGEVIDARRFLIERLRVPSELYVASAASKVQSRYPIAGSARS